MFVAHFEGLANVNSEEELMKLLKQRPKLNANNFVLSFNETAFPQLNILVKNYNSVIYYMANNENYVSYDESYHYVLDEGDSDANQEMFFYENADGEEIIIMKSYLISIESMKNAALEFFHTQVKPTCIGWDEL